ncbi:ankyrin-like protein [Yokapox virus]|uniref:Ankyrin-like protein n=1 Tax=Yokapox virus TaxID=1076255 RepID=G3EI75_9POXV|nr:ankyrin-like protein [Yokapox virus]AEN03772.1 ankyrin-like protein [Yokapox virus]
MCDKDDETHSNAVAMMIEDISNSVYKYVERVTLLYYESTGLSYRRCIRLYFRYVNISPSSKILKYILDNCNVNMTDKDNNTILHYYFYNYFYNDKVANMILDSGIDVTIKNDRKYTAVYAFLIGCSNVTLHTLEKLIRNITINDDYKDLLLKYIKARSISVSVVNIKIISKLLEKGINPKYTYKNGSTPLHYYFLHLATLGRSKSLINNRNLSGRAGRIISMLLEYGADINATNDNGNTPLHMYLRTCVRRKIDIVKMLLKFKPDISIRNNQGLNPIITYIESESIDIDVLKILLTYHEINFGEIEEDDIHKLLDRSIEYYDSSHGLTLVIYLMNKFNIGVNDFYKGETLIHSACKYYNTWVIDYLIYVNADINTHTKDGKSVMTLITENNSIIYKHLLYIMIYLNDANTKLLFDLMSSRLTYYNYDIIENFTFCSMILDDTFYPRYLKAISAPLNYRFNEFIFYSKVYSDTIIKCNSIIQQLKETYIRGRSLYSLLRCKDDRILISYINDLNRFCECMSNDTCKSLIKQKLAIASYKKYYIDACINKLSSVINDKNCLLSVLPLEIIYEILHMLSIYDLNILYSNGKFDIVDSLIKYRYLLQ